jgi:26S proteasome regulatory subunit N5
MARREKTEFILDQVALCIECEEWTQAAILSRKIGTKYFARKPTQTPEQKAKAQHDREEYERTRSADDPPVEPEDDTTDMKLTYYAQQVQLATNESKYLDACKDYRQVLDTQAVEDEPAKLRAVSVARPNMLSSLTLFRPFNEYAGMSS